MGLSSERDCPECGGSGHAVETVELEEPIDCALCGGTGKVRMARGMPPDMTLEECLAVDDVFTPALARWRHIAENRLKVRERELTAKWRTGARGGDTRPAEEEWAELSALGAEALRRKKAWEAQVELDRAWRRLAECDAYIAQVNAERLAIQHAVSLLPGVEVPEEQSARLSALREQHGHLASAHRELERAWLVALVGRDEALPGYAWKHLGW